MASRFSKFLGSLLGPKRVGSEGDGEAPAGEAVEYKGCVIRPTPRREGSQWLTAGVISKQIAEEVKEHRFVRADLFSTREDADACALRKARQIIDEQGDRLFQ